MKAVIAGGLGLTLIFGTVPVRADFKYTDTSQITGGAAKSMMKMAGIFSKQASQITKPLVTTRYVKGNKLRTDHPDGSIQIIDIDARLIINIDPQKHTYSQMTFEEMKAALEKAQQNMKEKMAEQKAKDPKKDVQANVKAKVYVTPSTATREIMGQTTNELKVQIDMEVEAQQTPSAAAASGEPSGPVSGTISTNVDSWVAPSISGYKEFAEFYVKMAKEINWTPPSNIQVNPQVSQGMAELQKNQGAFKGLPLLQYMTMTMVGQQNGQPVSAQNTNNSDPQAGSTTGSSVPTSPSQAMVKGLGGLFNKKKKDPPPADPNSQSPPPPPSTPGSLIEMTIQVNSFSDSALDAGLFQPPAGYTKVAQDPNQPFGGKPGKQ